MAYSKSQFSAAMLSFSPIHKPRPLLDASTFAFWASLLVVFLFGSLVQAAPIVSNLTAAQRAGTKLVDITYDLAATGLASLEVTLEASSDGGTTWTVPVESATGAVGVNITPGIGKSIVWNAGADWPRNYTKQMWFRITAGDGFVLIPAGSFIMGRNSNDTDFNAPPVTVNVSAFYISKYEVTKDIWDEVRAWALNNGYTDLAEGRGLANNHPVNMVTWWDVVKWCNARSEKDGLRPCYMAGGSVMRTGITALTVDWTANGYRLPTEAEWEKAARGGAINKRFPWGTDTISHAEANFRNNGAEPYQSGSSEYHPDYIVNSQGNTSPIGAFAANGFGLHDMAGNVVEWCWDWYGASSYVDGVTDPRGPSSSTLKVLRGGSYAHNAAGCRAASRLERSNPTARYLNYGFRDARSLTP